MKEIEELKENLYDATIKFLKEKESIIASDKQDKHALAEDRKRIEGEMKRISNVKSGFYKDLEEELANSDKKYTKLTEQYFNKKKLLESKMEKKKTEVIKVLQGKLTFLDENRKTNIADLKSEKARLETQILLNDTTSEQYLAMGAAEQREVRNAKEKVLINKKRLNEVLNTIQTLESLLDGKTAKDKYIEINNMIASIENKFNFQNIEEYRDELDKENTNLYSEELGKAQQDEQPEQTKAEEKQSPKPDEQPEQAKAEEKQSPKPDEQPEQAKVEEKQSPKPAEQPEQAKVEEKQSPKPAGQPEQTKTEEKQQPKSEQNKPLTKEQIIAKRRANTDKHDIIVEYSAKDNTYAVGNPKTKFLLEVNRNDLYSKKDFAAKVAQVNKEVTDLDNVDTNILQALGKYDKENDTLKAKDYYTVLTKNTENNKAIKDNMSNKKITICYDLRGLYDKVVIDGVKVNKFSAKERMMILEDANNAKKLGVAYVRKGTKVRIREMLEKFRYKMTLNKMLYVGDETEKKESKESDKDFKNIEKNLDKEIDKMFKKESKKQKRRLKNKPSKESMNKKGKFAKMRDRIARKAYAFADKIKVSDDIQSKLSQVAKDASQEQQVPERIENSENYRGESK